ncbi:MAG: hypothetical protein OXK82_02080 [Deltaproteobacteria bacterium]|nr:hypothetical protein [Deltaproteobacteria bacterium]
MSTYEIASLIVSAASTVAVVGSIWYGIYRMGTASDQRSKREDQRHAEAMTALRALIERTAP